MPELFAEKAVQFAAADGNGAGNLRRTDRLTEVVGDESQRLPRQRVGNGGWERSGGEGAQEISVTPVYNVYGREVKGTPSTATLTNVVPGFSLFVR